MVTCDLYCGCGVRTQNFKPWKIPWHIWLFGLRFIKKKNVFVLESGDRRTGLLDPDSARWNTMQMTTDSAQHSKLFFLLRPTLTMNVNNKNNQINNCVEAFKGNNRGKKENNNVFLGLFMHLLCHLMFNLLAMHRTQQIYWNLETTFDCCALFCVQH